MKYAEIYSETIVDSDQLASEEAIRSGSTLKYSA